MAYTAPTKAPAKATPPPANLKTKYIGQLAVFSPVQGAATGGAPVTTTTPATTFFATKQTTTPVVAPVAQAQNQDQFFTANMNKKSPRILASSVTQPIGFSNVAFTAQPTASKTGRVINNAPNKANLALKGASPAKTTKSAAAASYAYRLTK